MTFDEWFQSKQGEAYDSMYVFARDAWNAAIEAEREACAKVCEATAAEVVIGSSEEYSTGREMGATVCANRIRMRSNVELTGAAPTKGETKP